MQNFNLDNKKIPPGFKAPDNYFDQLPDQVMRKIHLQQKEPVSIFGRYQYELSVAAVLIVMLAVTFLTNNSVDPIDDSSIEQYLAYEANISQYEIISLMSTDEIDNITIDYDLPEDEVESILETNKGLENLLIDN